MTTEERSDQEATAREIEAVTQSLRDAERRLTRLLLNSQALNGERSTWTDGQGREHISLALTPEWHDVCDVTRLLEIASKTSAKTAKSLGGTTEGPAPLELVK